MTIVSPLVDAPACAAEMDLRSAHDALYPIEEQAIAQAVPRRRREFIAGRTCARRAMAALGAPPAPVPQNRDRAPQWPEGLVGSITHAGSWCAAALARRSDGVLSIGLDIETTEPLRFELWRIVLGPEEIAELEARPPEQRGILAKLIFSAKECAYKCQYVVTRTLLGFHAMRVKVDLPQGRFVAVFRRAAGPFAPGDHLQGRLRIAPDYLATAIILRA